MNSYTKGVTLQPPCIQNFQPAEFEISASLTVGTHLPEEISKSP